MTSALATKLDSIQEHGGITSRDVAQLLDTTPQTISRWRNGQAAPQPRLLERLLTLEWLAARLGDFYDADEAKLWLFSKHRLLNGERPADLIAQQRTDEVLAVIDQLESAAFI